MKNCPDCGYPNTDLCRSCGICGRNLDSVQFSITSENGNRFKRRLAAAVTGLVVAAGVGYAVFLGLHSDTADTAAQAPEDRAVKSSADGLEEAKQESGETINGTIKTLHAVSNIRFPGEDEISLVSSSFDNRAVKIKIAALEVLGLWIKNGVENIPEPLKKILNAIHDEDPSVRSAAAKTLGDMLDHVGSGKTGYVPAWMPSGFHTSDTLRSELNGLISDASGQVREQAVCAAGVTGDDYWKPRLEYLSANDEDKFVRLAAAGGLVRLGHISGMDFLIEFAGDKDREVRSKAAQRLAYSPYRQSENILKKMMANDADAQVREAAESAFQIRRRFLNIGKVHKGS